MTSTDTTTVARHRSGDRGPHRAKGYRPDIEGLRAVAIGLVLVYHAGVRFVPGGFVGVDVFFVISGFLITGLLIRELEQNGRVSLTRFYARRAKRLLPATGVVLVATAAMTWWTASVVEWRTFGMDIVGSALYVVNWVFAVRSVDYLAEDVGVSPVQHFWSLAVEEQFYIVWPLLLLVVGWWVRRRSQQRLRAVMTVGIAVVIVPSFVWSVIMTANNPASAFFVTPTRLWELGIGAFVAIGAGLWRKVPRIVAIILGWIGLIAVATSGLIVTEEWAWPGYAALWPTLGTAAVIVAGYTSGRAGPAGLLAWQPAVWIGGLSYSLYLWHWPLLVSATAMWGELGAKRGLLVVAFSFIPAYLSYKLIENPIRFAQPVARSNRLALSLGANFSLIGVAAGLALALVVPSSSTPADDLRAAGAEALGVQGQGTVESLKEVDWFVPAVTEAVDDRPASYDQGCSVDQVSPVPILCEYGDPDGDVTIAMVGDSKIIQWQSALDAIAKEHGWHIYGYIKSACAFSTGTQLAKGKPYTSCAEWNDRMLTTVTDLDPDLVLVSNRVNRALEDPDDPDSRTTQAMEDALAERWQELANAGIPVLVLLDNPSPGMAVYECVAEHMDDPEACTFDRDEGTKASAKPVQLAAAKRVPGVRTIDMVDYICPDDECVPVIGHVLVYRQTSHLTDTYVRTLTDDLAEQLVPAVKDLASG